MENQTVHDCGLPTRQTRYVSRLENLADRSSESKRECRFVFSQDVYCGDRLTETDPPQPSLSRRAR